MNRVSQKPSVAWRPRAHPAVPGSRPCCSRVGTVSGTHGRTHLPELDPELRSCKLSASDFHSLSTNRRVILLLEENWTRVESGYQRLVNVQREGHEQRPHLSAARTDP